MIDAKTRITRLTTCVVVGAWMSTWATNCLAEPIPVAGYYTQLQNKVLSGSVVQVSPVPIAANQTAEIVGGVTGASVGSALGSLVPGGSIVQIASIIGGGVLGAAAGSNVATHATSKLGQDLFIRLDRSDEIVNVTQTEDSFTRGDRVLLVYTGGYVRVVRNSAVSVE